MWKWSAQQPGLARTATFPTGKHYDPLKVLNLGFLKPNPKAPKLLVYTLNPLYTYFSQVNHKAPKLVHTLTLIYITQELYNLLLKKLVLCTYLQFNRKEMLLCKYLELKRYIKYKKYWHFWDINILILNFYRWIYEYTGNMMSFDI